MAKKLPVDFEKKVKQPPGVDGRGYPYQLSAKDLMLNFNALLKLLPDGKTGDMLYHDGTEWVLLDNPGLPGTGDTNQLTHDGTSPVWATESATPGESDHPWKVTANGDDTVAVAAGRMTTHRINGTGDLGVAESLVGFFLEFAGANVTVTGAGYIYALCDIDHVVTGDDTLGGGSGARFYSERQVFSGTPTVVFSATAPATFDPYVAEGRNFAVVIATVTLAASIAAVGTQYIQDHIPPIGGSYTYEATP